MLDARYLAGAAKINSFEGVATKPQRHPASFRGNYAGQAKKNISDSFRISDKMIFRYQRSEIATRTCGSLAMTVFLLEDIRGLVTLWQEQKCVYGVISWVRKVLCSRGSNLFWTGP